MGDISRSASVRFEKIALYGNKQDAPSTPGNGGSDQSRTSLRLAWRDWSRTNEALSIYACDATVNRLIIDTVGDGIRQQYRAVLIFIISLSKPLAESSRKIDENMDEKPAVRRASDRRRHVCRNCAVVAGLRVAGLLDSGAAGDEG